MSDLELSTNDPAISVSADISLVPTVTNFVENSSIAMGLGSREAMALTLASEEIFVYLCMTVSRDRNIAISCINGSYYVRLDFLFDAGDIDIGAFNITSKVKHDDEASLNEMGLLIASRSVDRFCFSQKTGALSRLTLVCDKKYDPVSSEQLAVSSKQLAVSSKQEPVSSEQLAVSSEDRGQRTEAHAPEPPARCRVDKDGCLLLRNSRQGASSSAKATEDMEDDYSIMSPDEAAIEAFARQVWAMSGTVHVPGFFEFPGKVVDMVQSEEFAMGIAMGSNSEIGGGIIWTRPDAKTVECFGPYLFGQSEDSEMSAKLVDFCISGIARTATVGLWSRYRASLPDGYFESLGELEIKGPDGSSSAVTVSFRQTKDDPGCSICTDKGIEAFLREKYDQLSFPREIRTDWNRDAVRPLRSVLAADLDRTGCRATLRPVLAGDDCSDNIAEHLALLQSENIGSILFEMDLGESWQASFVPALLANGFRPMVLLPYAGKGDIVVFQLDRSGL